jgi:putative transposase
MHLRRLSKKKRGSNRRKKAKQKVALAHLKVTRTRKHFPHETAARLVKQFDALAIEDLNVKGMVKNPFWAKAISDVAWSVFFSILQSKAENAGRRFEQVNARFTSQDCHRCGHRQKRPLKLRVFVCGGCGQTVDRELNAAHNILGRSAPEERKARGDATAQRRSGNVLAETSAAPLVVERVAFSLKARACRECGLRPESSSLKPASAHLAET